MSPVAVAAVVALAAASCGVLLRTVPRGRRARAAVDPLRLVGERLRRRGADRLPSLQTVTDRELGGAAAAAVALVVVAPPLVLVPAVGVGALGIGRVRSRRVRRRRAIDGGMVQLVDLLALAIAGGLPLRSGFVAVAPGLAAEHRALVDGLLGRVDNGQSFADGLRWYGDGLGPAGHELAAILVSSERDGAPLAAGLERAADATRRAQRRELERRARRLPVTLLLPLVVCILPAFIVLTLVPLLAGTLGDLRFPT